MKTLYNSHFRRYCDLIDSIVNNKKQHGWKDGVSTIIDRRGQGVPWSRQVKNSDYNWSCRVKKFTNFVLKNEFVGVQFFPYQFSSFE